MSRDHVYHFSWDLGKICRRKSQKCVLKKMLICCKFLLDGNGRTHVARCVRTQGIHRNNNFEFTTYGSRVIEENVKWAIVAPPWGQPIYIYTPYTVTLNQNHPKKWLICILLVGQKCESREAYLNIASALGKVDLDPTEPYSRTIGSYWHHKYGVDVTWLGPIEWDDCLEMGWPHGLSLYTEQQLTPRLDGTGLAKNGTGYPWDPSSQGI